MRIPLTSLLIEGAETQRSFLGQGAGLFNREIHGIHEKEAWLFMKFHVFHGSGLFSAEAQRRRDFLGAGLAASRGSRVASQPLFIATTQ